jgi:hypothetical protein
MNQKHILPLPSCSLGPFRGNRPQWLQSWQRHLIGPVVAKDPSPANPSLQPVHRNVTHSGETIDGDGGEMGDTL